MEQLVERHKEKRAKLKEKVGELKERLADQEGALERAGEDARDMKGR